MDGEGFMKNESGFGEATSQPAHLTLRGTSVLGDKKEKGSSEVVPVIWGSYRLSEKLILATLQVISIPTLFFLLFK